MTMHGLAARAVTAMRAVRQRPDPAAEVDAIAAITERLAVLLAAGVSASTAWSHVGEPTSSGGGSSAASLADAAVLGAAARAASSGDQVAAAIAEARAAQPAASGAWSVLAAAWSVAAESGAPLASSLRSLAGSLRDEAQLRREVRSALAGPAASASLVTALPLIAIVFGTVLGFDTLAVLFGNPLGLSCLALGAGFLWAGRRWNAALAERASRGPVDAGLELELLAIAMSGGTSIERARAIVRAAMAEHAAAAGDGREVESVLGLASRAGAPVAALLRAEAFRLRRSARAAGEARAATLGVRLMLPLGLCVLPAFVLLGVAPLMISVITGTLGRAV